MGTQKLIAKKIIEADSDYVLSLKDNHPTLHQQVKNWFESSLSLGFKDVDVNISHRVEKGHNRIENRKVYTVPVSQLPALHEQNDWVGLTTVVMVVRSIQHWNKITNEVQFYITSLTSDANKIGSAIRQHWGIENSVHWTKDMSHFTKMNAEFVLYTVHKILLYCVVLHSMPWNEKHLFVEVFAKKLGELR